jgi:M6 family metalloprotease-like protein
VDSIINVIKMKSALTVLLLAFSIQLSAAPYNGEIVKFRQPDGTSVDVRLFGDEYYMRAEGLDNYTLIRDKTTGWICYAVLSDNGSGLVSTGIVYKGRAEDNSSLRNDLTIPKHLDINGKNRIAEISGNKRLLNRKISGETSNNTPPYPVSGNIKGLCIVVDFSDEPATVPISEFTDFCNKMDYSGYGNNGSLRKYYSDISGGVVDYQNVVYGYFRAPNTFEYYDQLPQSQGAPQILAWALNKLDTDGFDFSTLSTNPDGSIIAINLMFTGSPQNWSQGLWWHQGYYPDFSADGVHSGDYNCSPANAPLILATVAHENGHMIGKWPDTYKYTADNGPDGIGSFDLMSYYGNSYNPVPPNPLFRMNAGWGTVVDITNYNGLITDVANSLTCYKYQINNSDEFFLLEARRKTGRSTYIPDEGLTIWHVDRTGDNQSTHHEIYLVHANNNIEDHTQACFHTGFNNEFSSSTTPGSGFYNGDPSGLKVRNISSVSNSITYNIGPATAAPSFHLSFQSISGDTNGNGFLEPGESGSINILAANGGGVNSGSASIVCAAIGANAGYVTINTPAVNAGVITLMQTVPVSHNISINAGTPVGTMIDLRFTISDGTYSTYMTKTFIAGRQILMDNQQVATCSAMFYDRGGAFSNYENMTDYITTISSTTPNQPVKVEFLSFELEADQNCIFDYLKIYNGGSVSSPLLGTFCGTNSPGTITSTDPSGKLTFQFHSDVGWRYSGWSARISCTGATSVSEEKMSPTVKIYPNPSKGIINISRSGESDAEIFITDISGKVIFCNDSFTDKQKVIDISDKSNGIYFLHIKTKSETILEKIIISK